MFLNFVVTCLNAAWNLGIKIQKIKTGKGSIRFIKLALRHKFYNWEDCLYNLHFFLPTKDSCLDSPMPIDNNDGGAPYSRPARFWICRVSLSGMSCGLLSLGLRRGLPSWI